jgi:2-oxoglutarate ferredoxin oxidoreductase subunit delta
MVVKNNNMPRIRTEIKFKQEWCKGCGYCEHVCERGVYAMRHTDRTVTHMESYVKNPRQCVGCGYCELLCPDQVMAIIGSWGLNLPRGEVSHGKGSKQ